MLRKVAVAAASKPHVEIRQDGDQFYIKTSTTVRTTEINFKIGESFEEETVDGRKCRVGGELWLVCVSVSVTKFFLDGTNASAASVPRRGIAALHPLLPGNTLWGFLVVTVSLLSPPTFSFPARVKLKSDGSSEWWVPKEEAEYLLAGFLAGRVLSSSFCFPLLWTPQLQ